MKKEEKKIFKIEVEEKVIQSLTSVFASIFKVIPSKLNKEIKTSAKALTKKAYLEQKELFSKKAKIAKKEVPKNVSALK